LKFCADLSSFGLDSAKSLITTIDLDLFSFLKYSSFFALKIGNSPKIRLFWNIFFLLYFVTKISYLYAKIRTFLVPNIADFKKQNSPLKYLGGFKNLSTPQKRRFQRILFAQTTKKTFKKSTHPNALSCVFEKTSALSRKNPFSYYTKKSYVIQLIIDFLKTRHPPPQKKKILTISLKKMFRRGASNLSKIKHLFF
jgi:hypothetical protein